VALSRKFRWIEVNRDHNPKIPKQFNVSAYPSLIVLGDKREKVYRFKSFKKPVDFIPELQEGLRRFDLYKKGERWDFLPPRKETICDGAEVQTFKAPSEEQPGGMAILAGKLWVAQGDKLHRVELQTARTEKTYDLPRPVRGLCAGRKFLYGVDFGWTMGKPIYVFDPAQGKIVNEIVTEANKKNRAYSANGIAWVDGKLIVSARGGLHEVDPESGEVLSVRRPPRRGWKLCHDGKHFVTATRANNKQHVLLFLDVDTLKVVREVPINYGVSAIVAHGGNYLLMEQPVRGFNTKNERVRLWPKQMLVYQVKLPPRKTPPATEPAPKRR
jgi:hypothetical protein